MIAFFVLFLLIFAFIGLASLKKKKANTKDYLLAGGEVKPWLVALSAVATNSSGYMFIGMIGFTYQMGLRSIWLMIGWIVGDFISSFFVQNRLKKYVSDRNILSFSTIVAYQKGKIIRIVQIFSGIITLIFLSMYTAAQLSAAGKAIYTMLDWSNFIGILLGALLVIMYCFSGGIRASIWTDAAQSIVMLFVIIILFIYAVDYGGGMENIMNKLSGVSENYLSLFHTQNAISMEFLFVLGWLFSGFGTIGQPQIMVRYMTLKDGGKIGAVRWYYYSWFLIFWLLVVILGLLCRVLLSAELTDFDPEIALPLLAMQILPDYLLGILLAGIFAACISTADSLVINCTASLSNDIFPKLKDNYKISKVFTVLVVIFAFLLALSGSSSIFEIVIYSWSVLGSAFGPIVVLRMFGLSVDKWTSLAMMTVSLTVVVLWVQLGKSGVVTEIVPGILSALFVYLLSCCVIKIFPHRNR